MSAMFLRRSALGLASRSAFRPAVATRAFSVSVGRYDTKESRKDQDANPKPGQSSKLMKPFEEITNEKDLLAPGGKEGTIPTDLEQSTGLERLEILGKMQGVDIFDMRPLDASRKGTLDNPIVVKSYGDEQYLGCTGYPVDTHNVIWLTTSRDRPVERCPECGSAYKLEYVGPQDSGHHDEHGNHGHDSHADSDGSHNFGGEPKTLADYVRPEYR